MLNVINSNEKTEGQLFAETELNYYALQVVTKYENLIKLYENNKQSEVINLLNELAPLLEYEDCCLCYLGLVSATEDVKVTEGIVNRNRLKCKVLYNYKSITGSNDILLHPFIIKTLKDLHAVITNDLSNKDATYSNKINLEFMKMVIKYMMCNPEFERLMINNYLDITKISCDLPKIDSEYAKKIILKHTNNISNIKYENEEQKYLISLFNELLFKNLSSYLNNDVEQDFAIAR